MVMRGGSRSKGRGFESQCRKLDRHDIFHIDCCKNCNDVRLKRPKINDQILTRDRERCHNFDLLSRATIIRYLTQTNSLST